MGLPDTQRLAAFVEYVCRPLVEDIKEILERAQALDLGLTEQTIKRLCLALGLWHLAGELLRAVTYIVMTWLICKTVVLLV